MEWNMIKYVNTSRFMQQKPIHPDSVKELENAIGPEDDKEAIKLANEEGFSYQATIGKLLFIYVICRPDIGYTVAELSKFSNKPAQCHYKTIKRVYRYLCQTIDWRIIFWRSEPQEELLMRNHKRRALSKTDLKFQLPSGLDQLKIYIDAAHAMGIKSRRSIGGHITVMAGTTIAYSAKCYKTISTSPTKVEFIQATSAAKLVKYIRAILKELKMEHYRSMMIFEDNVAAIMM
eukprot:5425597-Ditylum_brightwellii.AAC.1